MRRDCWYFDQKRYSSVSVRDLLKGGLSSSHGQDARKVVAKDSIFTAPSDISN